VISSSYANIPIYSSLAKRGQGRFFKHNFKIPYDPPLPKGDKKPIADGLLYRKYFSLLL
jgi:hypothetical protein